MKGDLWIEGDLCQMSNQEKSLVSAGIPFSRSDVYRIVPKEQTKKALAVIWGNKVDGWWHYLDKYVDFGICTIEEYDKALREQK